MYSPFIFKAARVRRVHQGTIRYQDDGDRRAGEKFQAEG
jgi:hypothetical protein